MMGESLARAPWVVVGWLFAWVAACAGKSQNPPPDNGNAGLACLTTLDSYCCSDAAAQVCIGDFASASRCGAWPSGVTVHVYPTACQGLRAVRVDGTWSTFYVFDGAGALLAIGDNAASLQDPRDTTIECGAGASTFSVPTACGDAWLSSAGAQACGAGPGAMTSYCAR